MKSKCPFPSNYNTWEREINFDDIDPNHVTLKDVNKIEKLNNLKINIHVWERGLKGCVFNDRKNLSEKTVNILLIVNDDGERHYCGIPSLS